MSRTRRTFRAAGRAATWPFRMLGRLIARSGRAIADAIGDLVEALIP